jgi:hypothetical protein
MDFVLSVWGGLFQDEAAFETRTTSGNIKDEPLQRFEYGSVRGEVFGSKRRVIAKGFEIENAQKCSGSHRLQR